ncbi:cytochrome b561 and DOMON domain-containing protein At4g12980-like [Phragmites australis]|uniref:cytochrome b561 and DOMON domain-containing protein At4g12980-like n=1 Tax=Phragmites australis TaxID=29695 RepID=UPI002D792FCA|nr:cytochrome b561 and DOMON domain-containing protein At4g12980-like [Phragmites australis]
MARSAGHSAWLLLFGAVLLFASAATAQDCLSATFSSGRTFGRCNFFPVLGASLHWTYHPENGTADVAFRAPSGTNGWVGWGINPDRANSMPGSSVFIASQDGNGVVSVLMTNLESTAPSLTNGSLKFDVPVAPSAEYSGGAYTIFATIALPGNNTNQNTVWQAGPLSGGAISRHPTSGPNLLSTQRLDFLSGASAGASNSRLHRRNTHGVLNAVSWGILIPLGAIIARYLRVFESADPAWFYLHIACQCTGYVLGVAGWGLGLKLGSESIGTTYQPHRNIGIAIFCLATLQVFALLLRPDKKNKYRFYWNIYHHSVGYSVIILSAINIFKGLNILKPGSGYRTAYIVVLATLGGIALCLEPITWLIVLRRRKRDADKSPARGANDAGWQQGV